LLYSPRLDASTVVVFVFGSFNHAIFASQRQPAPASASTAAFHHLLSYLHVVNGHWRSVADQPIVLAARHELGRLGHCWGVLRLLLDLGEIKLLLLQQIIYGLCVGWLDTVLLSEILVLDDWLGDLAKHNRRVGVEVVTGLVVHDVLVQVAWLIVLGDLSLVVVVRFAADDIVGDLIWCFGGVGAELGHGYEGVGGVLRVAGVVGIDTHLAIEVKRREGGGHEWAVH